MHEMLVNETLTVVAWPDPVLDRVGHDPRSPYVERFWLPLLGPTSFLFLRRLADELDAAHGEPVVLEVGTTSRSLGVGMKGGRNAPLYRTLARCEQFRLVHREPGTTEVLARRWLPSLTRFQTLKLPAAMQPEHAAWLTAADAGRHAVELRRRARHMALSLLEMGEDAGDAERHLHRLRFHPAIAREAVCWAVERHATAARAAAAAG